MLWYSILIYKLNFIVLFTFENKESENKILDFWFVVLFIETIEVFVSYLNTQMES